MNENIGVPVSYRSELFTPPGSLWFVPAELLTAGILIVLFAALTLRMRGVPALAGLGLGLGVLAAVSLVLTAGGISNDVTGYIVIGLALFLATTVLILVPRLAVWWGREAWWVTLGNSLMASLLLGLSFWALDSLLSEVGFSLDLFGRPVWVIVPLLLSPLIALWAIWRRIGSGSSPLP